MKDQAGVDITVGCKVAEADFSYGDSIVESIAVPCVGGAFNVGVKWADLGKGGPAWSKEGGGRGAAHLLVIEAAAEDGGGGDLPPREFSEDELKHRRFKDRFQRSPTRSETELVEADWTVLEDDGDESGGEGGERQGGERQGGGEEGRWASASRRSDLTHHSCV